MAAPNLASPTTITGKTVYVTPSATTETTLLTNAASSNRALRLTALLLTNVNGTNTVDATVRLYNAASAGTAFQIARTMTVPAGAAIVVLGRDSSLWLEEDRRITVQASAANDLTVFCSYEEVA
jgi:hypothetical protein